MNTKMLLAFALLFMLMTAGPLFIHLFHWISG